MTTAMDPLDQVVRGYLDAVEHALADLPEHHRRELLRDLRDHIDAERAALDPPTEAGVRAIFDRLGDPATLAAAARLHEDTPAAPPTVVAPPRPSRMKRPGPLGWTLIAVGLTLLICLVAGFAGLVAFRTGAGSSGPAHVSTAEVPQPTHR